MVFVLLPYLTIGAKCILLEPEGSGLVPAMEMAAWYTCDLEVVSRFCLTCVGWMVGSVQVCGGW